DRGECRAVGCRGGESHRRGSRRTIQHARQSSCQRSVEQRSPSRRSAASDAMTEQVMVVERSELGRYIENRKFDLLRDDLDDILEIISAKHFFIDRPTAEQSPQYKQIIPYVVIRHGDSYFLLQRTSKQTEARLHHKLSIGVGGHINPDSPTILGGL